MRGTTLLAVCLALACAAPAVIDQALLVIDPPQQSVKAWLTPKAKVEEIKQDSTRAVPPVSPAPVDAPVTQTNAQGLTTQSMESNTPEHQGNTPTAAPAVILPKKDLEMNPTPVAAQETKPDVAPAAPAVVAMPAPPSAAALPKITIAIPSMRRFTHEKTPAPEHYLKPLLQGLHGDLTDEEKHSVSFLIMNVDKEPELHKELMDLAPTIPNLTVLTKSRNEHVDLAAYLPTNNEGLYTDAQGRQVSKDTLNWRAGETMDAPRLWLTASASSDYVLFLEDDVTPTSHAMSKIYKFLREMNSKGKNDFLMIDLYTPAISWGPQTATNMEIYPYECCTQAMLFKSSRLAELCSYEFDHPDSPVDDNIRDFVRQDPNGRQVYAMIPNPFEHVGRYSTNPEKSYGVIEHRSLFFEP